MVITETHIAFFLVCIAWCFQTWRKSVWKYRSKRFEAMLKKPDKNFHELLREVHDHIDGQIKKLQSHDQWPDEIEVKDK